MSADDDRLYQDPALARFYDLENGWGADFDVCATMAKTARSVLDLGCGTGQLAAALAEGRDVTAVDPAHAMLDIARARPGGERVEWIAADAREFRSERRFDLIVLTGHAFQVFLTDEDRRAVLRTIAHHLRPEGKFIFDTRNPSREAWRAWTPQRSLHILTDPELGPVEAWNDIHYDRAARIVTCASHYRVKASGQVISAKSRIAFIERDALAALLHDAGLQVEQWLGDWTGGAFTAASKEIIPIGRLWASSVTG